MDAQMHELQERRKVFDLPERYMKSMDELKTIVLGDNTDYRELNLDDADIIEMTVEQLKTLKMSQENGFNKYQADHIDCVQELEKFLIESERIFAKSNECLQKDFKALLIKHLEAYAAKLTNINNTIDIPTMPIGNQMLVNQAPEPVFETFEPLDYTMGNSVIEPPRVRRHRKPRAPSSTAKTHNPNRNQNFETYTALDQVRHETPTAELPFPMHNYGDLMMRRNEWMSKLNLFRGTMTTENPNTMPNMDQAYFNHQNFLAFNRIPDVTGQRP